MTWFGELWTYPVSLPQGHLLLRTGVSPFRVRSGDEIKDELGRQGLLKPPAKLRLICRGCYMTSTLDDRVARLAGRGLSATVRSHRLTGRTSWNR